MTSASSAAVHGGGGGGGRGGSAAAVAAIPKNIAPASAPTPIASLTTRRVGRAQSNMLAPSSGDQVAVTVTVGGKNELSRIPRLFVQNGGNLRLQRRPRAGCRSAA